MVPRIMSTTLVGNCSGTFDSSTSSLLTRSFDTMNIAMSPTTLLDGVTLTISPNSSLAAA